MKTFKKFYDAVAQIPKGKVATYADVARAAGTPRAARAVGNAMTCNNDTQRVPCHRVVKSDGRVGGYSGDLRKSDVKGRKLSAEGVPVDLLTGRIEDLDRFRFRGFKRL